MTTLPPVTAAGPIVARRVDAADLPQIMEAIEQSIDELRLWMDWAVEGVPTPESLGSVLSRLHDEFDRDVSWQYSVFEHEADAVVGGCGVTPMSDGDAVALNYWVRTDRCGRGYATAAVQALTSAAFRSLPDLCAVEVHTDQANERSAAIPRRLGFRLDRTVRREVVTTGQTGTQQVWSMKRSDWSPEA